jgi:hypothetical protein
MGGHQERVKRSSSAVTRQIYVSHVQTLTKYRHGLNGGQEHKYAHKHARIGYSYRFS